MMEKAQDRPASGYSAAEIGALAHLYRGEMYQSLSTKFMKDCKVA